MRRLPAPAVASLAGWVTSFECWVLRTACWVLGTAWRRLLRAGPPHPNPLPLERELIVAAFAARSTQHALRPLRHNRQIASGDDLVVVPPVVEHALGSTNELRGRVDTVFVPVLVDLQGHVGAGPGGRGV